MNICMSAILIFIILLVLTIIILSQSKNKKIRICLYVYIVLLVLCISTLGVGYFFMFYGISEYDYYYTIEIKNDSSANYTMFLPIPDEQLIDQLYYPGVEFSIEDTDYGKALNISSNQSFNVSVWVNDADSADLNLESGEIYRHYVYLNSDGNEVISLNFHYLPRHYGEDFDEIIYTGQIQEGWNEYQFNSVWG